MIRGEPKKIQGWEGAGANKVTLPKQFFQIYKKVCPQQNKSVIVLVHG